jgi:hypothetical protein
VSRYFARRFTGQDFVLLGGRGDGSEKILQKRIPQRSPSDFIGREVELKQFQRILDRLFNKQGYFIVNTSGQADIGKKELLRQYRQRLKEGSIRTPGRCRERNA